MTSFVLQIADPIGAAAGYDPSIEGELRVALVAAAMSYADALRQAPSWAHWAEAARRLAGLAASFGAVDLQEASKSALAGPIGNPEALHKIEEAIARLHGGSLQMS